MTRLGTMVLATLVAGTATAWGQDAALVEKGKAVYTANKCQSCHLVEGKGNKRFPLDGVGKKLSADDIEKWITHPSEMEAKLETKPKIHMKAYKLAEADLKALVAYMQSLK